MDDAWWVNQNQLDDDQKDVFSLSINENHLITGPPGSGKTNLLLLRARQLIGSNYPNVVLIVHTRNLQEFISSGAPNYGVSADKIMTFRKMGTDLLYQHGASIQLPSDFNKSRKVLADALLAQINNNNFVEEFSYVLIDEAQDFLPEEMKVLQKLGRRFFAVADSRQKIYPGQDPLSLLEMQANVVKLRYHYRNGKNICIVADGLSKHPGEGLTLERTSKYDEKRLESSVETILHSSLVEQCEDLVSRLDTQLKAYPGQMLGVACPRGQDLDEVIDFLRQSAVADKIIVQTMDEGYMRFDPAKPICVSKLHSAKGLEFRASHILAAEGVKKFEFQRNLAFMGVTRAKTSLCIYHSNSLPGYLEGALAKLQPSSAVMGLDDLLAKGGGEDEEGSEEV